LGARKRLSGKRRIARLGWFRKEENTDDAKSGDSSLEKEDARENVLESGRKRFVRRLLRDDGANPARTECFQCGKGDPPTRIPLQELTKAVKENAEKKSV